MVNEGGLRLLCLLRLLPVNPAIMGYAMAMTKVRLWPYLLASCCMIPAWILTVYFGCVATDVVKVLGGAPVSLYRYATRWPLSAWFFR